MFLLEMYYSYVTNSQALFADAWHVLSDTLPLCLGWYAVNARRKGKETSKLEQIITLTNVFFLGLVALTVGSGGLVRLLYPEQILVTSTIVVAAVGAVGNFFQMQIAHNLKGAHEHAHTSRGQMLHFFSDFLSSIAVILGAVCMHFGVRE